MAAAFPDHLLGPGGKPILPAGYESYGGGSWAELVSSSPMTAKYTEILFRMYGMFNLIVGLMGIAIAATAFRRGDAWALSRCVSPLSWEADTRDRHGEGRRQGPDDLAWPDSRWRQRRVVACAMRSRTSWHLSERRAGEGVRVTPRLTRPALSAPSNNIILSV